MSEIELLRNTLFHVSNMYLLDSNVKTFFTKEELNIISNNIKICHEKYKINVNLRSECNYIIDSKSLKILMLYHSKNDIYCEELLRDSFGKYLNPNKELFYAQTETPRTVGVLDVEEVYAVDNVWLFLIVWKGKERRKHFYFNSNIIRTSTFLGKRSAALNTLFESFD